MLETPAGVDDAVARAVGEELAEAMAIAQKQVRGAAVEKVRNKAVVALADEYAVRATERDEGPNEAHQLARWVQRRSTPHVDELKDWSDARPFLASLFGDDNNKGVRGLVVGVFASNSSTTANTFARVASGDDGDDLSFALTTKPELVAQALRERDHTISLDMNEDRVHVLSAVGDDVKTMQVDSSTTARAIASFVNSALEPAVTRFDSSTAASLFHGMRGPRVHSLLFVDEASKKGEGVADVFAALAADERYRARHVIVPSSEARVLKHFDLNSGFDLPTVILCDLRGLAPSVGDDEVVLDDSRDAHVHAKKAFAYRLRDWHASSKVDHDTLQSFYAAFFDGNLTKPFLRSQPIVGALDDAPSKAREASEEGRVVTLVGKTWDVVVEAARRDATGAARNTQHARARAGCAVALAHISLFLRGAFVCLDDHRRHLWRRA